ncbi:putative 4-hydroxybenzoate polyprenyltransferase [Pelotomaculum terephthalicicum JT]|uniref:UbiA-like polyprenyltransferase n=1 Tax=Pelotomaculum TaxID=191373 RepID=UPI0009CD6033|nr:MULTISPECIES: UbiA-like polyprenyltransferase [Pelotomaculum]MCG9966471.1 putative 4-hydroxybenzoate polyprenyltransferase [Pelotomaculum terephthalicicum JT]OPX85968.1 MAG: 4-hydroxybenzoate octaprenyltransferase [Pelotomaculum sp. PtaB.Bin117]OPY63388.1 MAG: 4-hydroxybenzoate octaprenyltransferase [Pelotomaculum sp. PtaU1.Bin065]
MVFKKLIVFLEMIRFEHTVFALPFAYIGALLTEKKIPAAHDLLWITMAMVGARTAAMSLNRLIDRRLDARNPRTAGRALPRGLLREGEVWFYVLVSFLLLFYSAYQLTPLAFRLAPAAVLVLFTYSYTKRFTWTCHLVLGLVLGMAPLGSWIAITGQFHPAPFLLGAGVLFWVAGFDIIYACDDYEFDLKEGLYSIPARFGIKRALNVSAVFHAIAPLFFLAAGLLLNLGVLYLAGVAVSVGILFYQHTLVRPDDLSRAGVAFFNLNGTLSVVMFVFTLFDIFFPLRIF